MILIQVIDHVLQPRKVGIAFRRRTILPAAIILQLIATPILQVKRRIRQDEIEALILMTVLKKCIGIELPQIGLDTSNSKVHRGHLPCSRVAFLPING